MKYLLIFCLVLVAIPGSGQVKRASVTELVKKIAAFNELHGDAVGVAGISSGQYQCFEKLRSIASLQELVSLLDHSNGVVKGYASWALADRKYAGMAPIFSRFLQSGEKVRGMHGCIVADFELATELYNRVGYHQFRRRIKLSDSLYFHQQLAVFDSTVLYSDRDDLLLSRALENQAGDPRYYTRVRYWALERKVPEAIWALGVYRNKEDIDAIKGLGKEAFAAIVRFPDPAFWDFLLLYRGKELTTDYFSAIAAFQSKAAAAELAQALPTLSIEEAGFLGEAITLHDCPFYQDIHLSIWRKHALIDHVATNQLIKAIPDRAARAFAEVLSSGRELHFMEYDSDYGTSEEILPRMLGHIYRHLPDTTPAVCRQLILGEEEDALIPALEIARTFKLPGITSAALEKMEEGTYPYQLFHLAETVLLLGNKAERQQAMGIIQREQPQWDTGNWSGAYRKLFKKYKIKLV
ncbi:hypothetical protein [Paraflavitalea pollutisoli]|uniref:hypothetical protein n=1 Tax=Paraflavitalea pollutisoli TaxID=3034143 RepID=UPI0023EDA99E|nr:hypothetical protein [Paraflavitalea sp. H1-2-19X]